MVINRRMYNYSNHYYELGFTIKEVGTFIHKIFELPLTTSRRIAEYCIYCKQANKGFCPIDVQELIR